MGSPGWSQVLPALWLYVVASETVIQGNSIPAALSAFSGHAYTGMWLLQWCCSEPCQLALVLLGPKVMLPGWGGTKHMRPYPALHSLPQAALLSLSDRRTFPHAQAWHKGSCLSLHCAGVCNGIVSFESHRHESSVVMYLKSGLDLLTPRCWLSTNRCAVLLEGEW